MPHDLVRHECIKRRFPRGTLATWQFADGNGEIQVTPTCRLLVSSAHNELQAALAGRGIAHIFDGYAKPHIRNGGLVELLPEWSPILPHWFLYYPSRRLPSATMRAFLDYVRRYDWQARAADRQFSVLP